MRKLLFLTAVVAAVLVAGPASATPPSPVAGTFTVVTITPTGTRTAGGNTFTTFVRTASLTGTFMGTTTDTGTLVTHRNGTTSVRGVGTCACSVEGRSGTFAYRFSGSGTFPTSLSGRYVVGHGTGGLAGLHAVGPFSGTFLVATVGGRYHFN
jgi:hypothetical protein